MIGYSHVPDAERFENAPEKCGRTDRIRIAELIWDGKYVDGKRQTPVRVALPFQTIETVNESTAERIVGKLSFVILRLQNRSSRSHFH